MEEDQQAVKNTSISEDSEQFLNYLMNTSLPGVSYFGSNENENRRMLKSLLLHLVNKKRIKIFHIIFMLVKLRDALFVEYLVDLGLVIVIVQLYQQDLANSAVTRYCEIILWHVCLKLPHFCFNTHWHRLIAVRDPLCLGDDYHHPEEEIVNLRLFNVDNAQLPEALRQMGMHHSAVFFLMEIYQKGTCFMVEEEPWRFHIFKCVRHMRLFWEHLRSVQKYNYCKPPQIPCMTSILSDDDLYDTDQCQRKYRELMKEYQAKIQSIQDQLTPNQEIWFHGTNTYFVPSIMRYGARAGFCPLEHDLGGDFSNWHSFYLTKNFHMEVNRGFQRARERNLVFGENQEQNSAVVVFVVDRTKMFGKEFAEKDPELAFYMQHSRLGIAGAVPLVNKFPDCKKYQYVMAPVTFQSRNVKFKVLKLGVKETGCVHLHATTVCVFNHRTCAP